MSRDNKTQDYLKLLHLLSTVWFMVCVGFVLAVKLYQEGFNAWIIFSLSGHASLAIILLTTVYAFTRGSKGQTFQTEHPLTVSSYYMGFYVAAPLLGSLAGVAAMTGETAASIVLGGAMGSLAATFATWIVIDPMLSLAEMLSPMSRQHRAMRLAALKEEMEREEQKKEKLLVNILAEEAAERERWGSVLAGEAKRLSELLVSSGQGRVEELEAEARSMGATAWRLGGLSCMEQLRTMAVELAGTGREEAAATDYISAWWDGVGNWRDGGLFLRGGAE
jgi:hypothetical protein